MLTQLMTTLHLDRFSPAMRPKGMAASTAVLLVQKGLEERSCVGALVV